MINEILNLLFPSTKPNTNMAKILQFPKRKKKKPKLTLIRGGAYAQSNSFQRDPKKS